MLFAGILNQCLRSTLRDVEGLLLSPSRMRERVLADQSGRVSATVLSGVSQDLRRTLAAAKQVARWDGGARSAFGD